MAPNKQGCAASSALMFSGDRAAHDFAEEQRAQPAAIACQVEARRMLAAGHTGSFLQGWERQFALLADNASTAVPLHKRVPQARHRARM